MGEGGGSGVWFRWRTSGCLLGGRCWRSLHKRCQQIFCLHRSTIKDARSQLLGSKPNCPQRCIIRRRIVNLKKTDDSKCFLRSLFNTFSAHHFFANVRCGPKVCKLIVPFFGGRQKTRKSNDFTLKFSVLIIHQIFLYPLHVRWFLWKQ
jgi:hypothetical protein